MPTTDTQWAWFVFDTGGAALGWLLPFVTMWWRK